MTDELDPDRVLTAADVEAAVNLFNLALENFRADHGRMPTKAEWDRLAADAITALFRTYDQALRRMKGEK